ELFEVLHRVYGINVPSRPEPHPLGNHRGNRHEARSVTKFDSEGESRKAGHRVFDCPSCARRLKALRFAPTARGAHARPSGLDATARSSWEGNYAMASEVTAADEVQIGH